MAAKKKAAKKKPATTVKSGGVRSDKTDERVTHERDENLQNAPAEGVKANSVANQKEKDDLDARIAPPKAEHGGTSAHMVRASRGEEVGHYQMPQSGVFNNTNLKA